MLPARPRRSLLGRRSPAAACVAALAVTSLLFVQGRAAAQSPDVHRVLVIPLHIAGRAPTVVDRGQVAQALFGATDSVASRYRTLSYGRLTFAGSERDIIEPVALSEPPDVCGTGLAHLADATESELQRRGLSWSSYQHLVFILPKDMPCAWAGLGDIGGKRVWLKATTVKAFQHELGHNLGMDHAVLWGKPGAEGSDFMGSADRGLNAPHIVEMGWLAGDQGKVVELMAAADVTVETLEADPGQSALPKIAIVRPASGANTYYLSYRAAGDDKVLPAEFSRGLNIHIADPTHHMSRLTYFVRSLGDGESYHDGPMLLQQLSHNADRVIFRVSFAGTGAALPAGPPPSPLGTLQSLASGKCLDLPGGQSSDGTAVIQYDCHGGPNQQWKVEDAGETVRIVSRMSGKCIGNDDAASRVTQSSCGRASSQHWLLKPVGDGYVLQNAANSRCLDVPGGSTANGTRLLLWTCNGGSNQTWRYASPATP
jgi:Ricin-type beta-trefoil lectin domain/Gametolysin peptidase M11